MAENSLPTERPASPVEPARVETGLNYEKPKLDLTKLQEAAKAFAPKSGMGMC